jgi:serine/threonine protein kinase
MSTTSAADSLNHDPLLRETLGGRYHIERLIGRGGVGLVYLARDVKENRRVVVKVLAPHWTDDDDAVARFDREALRMAKLDHPNVVKMYDHGHHRDQAYIVMEFLDGEPLRQYLNRKQYLSFEEFIPIASQILAGVGYVHARNIMLRDIKPPNIMLCEREGKANHVKLLDFGLAKLMGEDDELTKAHVIGTAGYLSPEQIRGDRIDVRVDVYALGILFFIMLTGESPIEGDNDAAVLFNHVHGTPRSLRDSLPDGHRVPDEVVELVHQCLAKTPADRPSDANEMAEVLFESVHPSMFLLPPATEESRAPARAFWEKRLQKGGGSLEDLEPHSGEFTRPVVKRTLQEVREAARIEAKAASGRHSRAQPAVAAPKAAAPKAAPQRATASRAAASPDPSSTMLGLPRPTSGRTLRPPPPPPAPKPSATTLGLPIPKGASRAVTSPPGQDSSETLPPIGGPAAIDARPGAAASRTVTPRPSKPKPTPLGSPRVSGPTGTLPPMRPLPTMPSVPMAAPAASLAAPIDTGLTVQFDAADARAAAQREQAPTDRVAADLARAAAIALGDGVPTAIARTSQEDSVPISFEEDGVAVPTPDVTAVGTGPITAIGAPVGPAQSRLGLVLALAGLGALALGGITAWIALADGDDTPKAAASDAKDERPAAGDADPAKPGDAERPSADAETAPGDADDDPPPDDRVAGAASAAEGGTPTEAGSGREGDPKGDPLGKITVRARRGATVFVDGTEAGTLPRALELPPGEHTIRIEADGYDPWESVVEVAAGDNPALSAELVRHKAGSKSPKSHGGSKPASDKPAAEPKAEPKTEPKAEPKTEPKTEPKPKNDDVFMNTSKGNDDGGIFLPVGK